MRPAGEGPAARQRPRAWGGLVSLLVVAVGLGLGIGASRLLLQPTSADTAPREPVTLPSDADAPAAEEAELPQVAPEPATAPAAAPPVEAARSAKAAVQRFLDAEIAHDFAASWALLSAADRRAFRSQDGWVAAHPDLPPITRYAIEHVAQVDGGVRVTAATRLESSLNQVTGLTPARARAAWLAVPEQGGWRVAVAESRLEPLYPPDDGAAAAAAEWVRSRQGCRDREARAAGLLGDPWVTERLCGAPGAVTTGAPAPLDDPSDIEPFSTAYGPEAATWARVVPVTEPLPLAVVVAPMADRWHVIGVLDESVR